MSTTDVRFSRAMPVSPDTLTAWQRELDAATMKGEHLSRLVIRWEPGDPWQPIHRWMLWQCVDPRVTDIEPWVLTALRGPAPRSTGHYCGEGTDPETGSDWCKCSEKANRWVRGATRNVDQATWELYQATGLYGTRWWTIQGQRGGHRYQWASSELASVESVRRGRPAQTPAPGDLPYAPFDRRVIEAIQGERRAAEYLGRLESLAHRTDAISAEERAEAEAKAKALWDWAGDQVDKLWEEGADLLPRYFEEQYGRAPIGYQSTTDEEALEQRFLSSMD